MKWVNKLNARVRGESSGIHLIYFCQKHAELGTVWMDIWGNVQTDQDPGTKP